MTREQQIEQLSRQYWEAMRLGRRKRASIIHARLCALKTRQIKSEMKARKAS